LVWSYLFGTEFVNLSSSSSPFISPPNLAADAIARKEETTYEEQEELFAKELKDISTCSQQIESFVDKQNTNNEEETETKQASSTATVPTVMVPLDNEEWCPLSFVCYSNLIPFYPFQDRSVFVSALRFCFPSFLSIFSLFCSFCTGLSLNLCLKVQHNDY
jgi:hypothetical protein